jgi:hypothetical protein
MTTLNKPVLRRVSAGSQSLRRDPLVLVLHPSGFIGVREAGRRAQYKVDLKTIVAQAVRLTTNKIIARTQELRGQGYKLSEARKRARQECLANIEE